MSVLALVLAGYLETYYEVGFLHPPEHRTNLRAFDDHERQLTLSNVALDLTASRGWLSTRLILQYGTTPASYYAAHPDWRFFQQASVTADVPRWIKVEAGLFPSPIGPEVIPVKDNWTWSRSDLFYALPAYHAGIRASGRFKRRWTATLHYYNGWNNVPDGFDAFDLGVSFSYEGPRMTAQVMYLGGPSDAGSPWHNLFDAFATIEIDPQVSAQLHLDAGIDATTGDSTKWIGAAIAGRVRLTPALRAAARFDVFHEHVPDGTTATLGPAPWFGSLTTTLAHHWRKTALYLELRHDRADDRVFSTGGKSRTTSTAGLTAWF